MDGKNAPKTKAELLQELQSIQSLLNQSEQEPFPALDDDDIPLLDEFIADEPETLLDEEADQALEADTLEALNAAYAALTDDLSNENSREKRSEDSQDEASAQPTSQPQANPTAPASSADEAPDPAQAGPAPASAQPDAQSHPDEPKNPERSGAGHSEGAAGKLTSTHTDPAAPAPLPGQQSLFDALKPDSIKAAKAALHAPKARGENPFLPQHIRERLRGNQVVPKAQDEVPPPTEPLTPAKAEFLQPKTPGAHQDLPDHHANHDAEPAAKPPADGIETIDRQGLIDQLVQEMLPKLEARLRELLSAQLDSHTKPHDH